MLLTFYLFSNSDFVAKKCGKVFQTNVTLNILSITAPKCSSLHTYYPSPAKLLEMLTSFSTTWWTK